MNCMQEQFLLHLHTYTHRFSNNVHKRFIRVIYFYHIFFQEQTQFTSVEDLSYESREISLKNVSNLVFTQIDLICHYLRPEFINYFF